MEDTIILLTLYAAVITALLIISAITIAIQRKQINSHNNTIITLKSHNKTLSKNQDLFPSGSITGRLDDNYLRKN
jgi:hypothetical protein